MVLKNGEVTDRFNTFVDPRAASCRRRSSDLTGITDEMLEGAPSQEEALRRFPGFCRRTGPWRPTTPSSTWALSPRAAGRYGIPFHNPSIDSLILAQNLLPDLGKYKLDIVAEHLHLPAFNHHRASDDAATVAYMLPPFFKMLEDDGHALPWGRSTAAMTKLRKGGKAKRQPKHLIVLAKNQTGLRNLYKLISLAHLEHFKRYPIMPKSAHQ